jgi:DUF1365 family protein
MVCSARNRRPAEHEATMSTPATASIGFGHVRHVRLRPLRHAFAYRSYFLRLPLRALAREPGPLGRLPRNRFGWLSFHDADHGDGGDPLAWIDALLAHNGVTDAAGEIWLHTLPRVFGYVFNPVSFWFCHRADGALRAVLCAVSNTFGERHCYLLAHQDGSPLAWGEELTAHKVFHVSPFCRVRGRYRFRFMLARRAGGDCFVGRIDYDDDDAPVLQTSVEGVLAPLNDAALWRARLRYPAFTLGVVARIHWQALQLWRKRVPFFSKPEPPALDVTR